MRLILYNPIKSRCKQGIRDKFPTNKKIKTIFAIFWIPAGYIPVEMGSNTLYQETNSKINLR